MNWTSLKTTPAPDDLNEAVMALYFGDSKSTLPSDAETEVAEIKSVSEQALDAILTDTDSYALRERKMGYASEGTLTGKGSETGSKSSEYHRYEKEKSLSTTLERLLAGVDDGDDDDDTSDDNGGIDDDLFATGGKRVPKTQPTPPMPPVSDQMHQYTSMDDGLEDSDSTADTVKAVIRAHKLDQPQPRNRQNRLQV